MANREELGIIRGARAGDAVSQLALGKLYLFGGASLPVSLPTALHWLNRAALQQQSEAWMLIGSHVPFEYAQHLPGVLSWYDRAYDAGVAQAGLVLEQLLQHQQQAQQRRPSDHDGQRADASGPREPVLQRCRDVAAQAGDRYAQLALGLWFARMDGDGKRQADGIAVVNFKRAIRWLELAAGQGLAEAWFALSRIYLKPEFSHRSVAEAHSCLERAAGMGHRAAQLECGMYAWRHRRHDENSDVRALYWLRKAADQQCKEAQRTLARITATPRASGWLEGITPVMLRELALRQPLLAARLTLAAAFGLSRAEALLIDVKRADQGHCLLVDIRASYRRSKRRLIVVDTAQERHILDDARRRFDEVDPGAVEGNYRQRLYRLKRWLPHVRQGAAPAPHNRA